MRAALIVLIACTTLGIAASAGAAGPAPIEHVLVLMQEDRTFDHYFGTYPGANGPPVGLSVPRDPDAPDAGSVEPFKLGVTRTISLPHSEKAMRSAFNDGSVDGFVRAAEQFGAEDGALTMGYYDFEEIPLYWNLANDYVLADNWFSSVMGPSFTNHMYLYAATAAGYTSAPEEGMAGVRTIFDALEEQGTSWKIYVQNYAPEANFRNPLARLGLIPEAAQLVWVPLLGIPRFVDDPELNSHIVDLNEYYLDLRNDALPAVSYIVPRAFSEHPPGDLVLGQYATTGILASLMRSSSWESSAFIITWDEWGGWFDHVSPPQVDADGYGFRVPALIVSPYAKRGYIDSTVYDHTSILKFIEWLFELPPLTERDARANNLLSAFDFTQPPRPPVAPAAVYVPPGEAGDSTADRTTLVSAVHTFALPVAIGAFVAALVVGGIVWTPWRRATAAVGDEELGLSRLAAVIARVEVRIKRLGEEPPLSPPATNGRTVPEPVATAAPQKPDREELDLSRLKAVTRRVEARIERLSLETPLSPPRARQQTVPGSVATADAPKPNLWRIDVAIDAERNFAMLLDVLRGLGDFPFSQHASVVSFRNGRARFAVEFPADANGNEIAQALDDSSAHQIAIEEARTEDRYLRLRVLDAGVA